MPPTTDSQPRLVTSALLKSRGAAFLPTTPRERTEQLEQTPWSQRLKWSEEEGIGRYLQSWRLPPDAILFREGEPGSFAAIVIGGTLEIRKADAKRQEHVVARTTRGQMVGEMSLIDGLLRSATAVSIGETEILVLSRDDFERMSQEAPPLALRWALMVAEAIATLLRQTTGRLIDHRGA